MSQPPCPSRSARDAESPLALEVEFTLDSIARVDARHALLTKHQLEALLALVLRASETSA